jgi:hypothetical protein
VSATAGERNADRWVLALISGGLILILLGMAIMHFTNPLRAQQPHYGVRLALRNDRRVVIGIVVQVARV